MRADSGQRQTPPRTHGVNGNGQVRPWQSASALLWPLDQAQVVAIEIVAHSQKFQFFRAGQSIQIKMIYIDRPKLVGFNQRVSGAFDRPGVTERANDAAAERGLAHAQIALQIDDTSPLQRLCNLRAQIDHGVVAVGQ